MTVVETMKCLGNDYRLEIVELLKEASNFEPQVHLRPEDDFNGGVCLGSIGRRIGLSQSTTSQFLSMLVACDLLESKKIQQYTYFRRNESGIAAFQAALKDL